MYFLFLKYTAYFTSKIDKPIYPSPATLCLTLHFEIKKQQKEKLANFMEYIISIYNIIKPKMKSFYPRCYSQHKIIYLIIEVTAQ